MQDTMGLEMSTNIYTHLQPGIHKNSEGLAILILEFDDMMVKRLYI